MASLIDDNGIIDFIDDNSVTNFIDDNSNTTFDALGGIFASLFVDDTENLTRPSTVTNPGSGWFIKV